MPACGGRGLLGAEITAAPAFPDARFYVLAGAVLWANDLLVHFDLPSRFLTSQLAKYSANEFCNYARMTAQLALVT
jgi:hypothetical protein